MLVDYSAMQTSRRLCCGTRQPCVTSRLRLVQDPNKTLTLLLIWFSLRDRVICVYQAVPWLVLTRCFNAAIAFFTCACVCGCKRVRNTSGTDSVFKATAAKGSTEGEEEQDEEQEEEQEEEQDEEQEEEQDEGQENEDT